MATDNVAFKYAVLATVAVRQGYYANDICPKFDVEPELDFDIAPTAECEAVMQRLDILARRSDRSGGLVLLTRVLGQNAAGEDLVRFLPTSTDKLTFLMMLRNPGVLSFDDLPADTPTGKLYYFGNQRSDAAAPRTDLHLSAAATGVDATRDQITAASADYRFHHSSTVNAADAKVTHLLTGTVLAPSAVVNQGGQSDLSFDLRGIPLGRCELTIAGVVRDEFYCAGNVAPRAFGVIELVLGSTLDGNYRAVEADRSLISQRPAYSVRLRNRHTRWRYSIQLQADSPLFVGMSKLNTADKADFLNRLALTTNDSAVTFTRQSATDTRVVFVSDSDLALQERYVSSSSSTHDPLSITLKKYVGVVAKEAAVRSDLPYPHGLIDVRSPPLIYSDIFLTF